MALIGHREDWQALVLRNDEPRVGLQDEHVTLIERALADAPSGALMVEVGATLSALKEAVERTPTARDYFPYSEFAALGADGDESWRLHRAQELWLMSIVPIEPWPRVPEIYNRPPGYLHSHGTPNPELQAQLLDCIERAQREMEASEERALDSDTND